VYTSDVCTGDRIAQSKSGNARSASDSDTESSQSQAREEAGMHNANAKLALRSSD